MRRNATRSAAIAAILLLAGTPACGNDRPGGGAGPAPTPTDTPSTAEGLDAPLPEATDPSTTDPDPTAFEPTDLFAAACAGELTVGSPGMLPDHLTSVSGLAASHRHREVVWAVEDSFEPPEVTAIDLEGKVVATVRLVGQPLMNIDWEAIAVGPGPDGAPWIHVADIGDNLGIRPQVRIHRFPEPDLADTSITPETILFSYPAGRPNAEAFLVDQSGGSWVVTKEPDGPDRIFGLGDDDVLVEHGQIDLADEQVTAIDLSPDGGVLALRTNRQLRLYVVPTGGGVVDAFETEPCTAPTLDERQGESVALLPGRTGVVTVSEDESGDPVPLHITAPR